MNAWAMYAVVGLAVAYASYRRGRVPLMSAILAPLMKDYRSGSLTSRIIDSLAIIATLFGTAASLGLGALQISRGFQIVTGWQIALTTLALIVIGILTLGTIASAVSGVARGIKWLSNVNLVLAIGLALFIFIVGPTVFLINIIPGVLIDYFASIPAMSARTMSDSEAMQGYLTGWTTFYWAWWVSWAPFVGIFTAKISQGRTIRQYVLGVLFLPMTIIVVAFTIMGGTSIWLQRQSGIMAADNTAATMPPAEDTFFLMLSQLPGSQVVAPIIMVMLAIFFVTTSDSASLVNSQLAQSGNPQPRRSVTAFFALLMAGIAVVMLLMGGQTALTGLQNLITVTALPFSIILIVMVVALWKDLRSDPLILRGQYETWAVEKAVRRGIDEHGDNFTLAIEPTTEDTYDYGAGSHFESDAEEYTAWYQHTDEDGEPIEHEFETPPAERH
ncbi:MAG TPA: BCCT family transporter [Tessaracoccus flavescens]|uniref:BCCT family transporter n=1 Tax=Tessaracoccus flavescens TaxID=399497 RepID=A0A921ENR9_9ACTN|nr:BCCT family transporter [Tessaracoccus flavescens]